LVERPLEKSFVLAVGSTPSSDTINPEDELFEPVTTP
jgi:hypothetical protein